MIFISLKRRRLLGSEPIISSVIISTSPASFILRESASSSPPSLSSVAAVSRIGVDHFFRHHLHFSSVGVVNPRRVGVIISAVTQLRFCGFSDRSQPFLSSSSPLLQRRSRSSSASRRHHLRRHSDPLMR
ncbi:hypothetical protein F2Q68_00005940 [Brassica cretica]|uniref:Uncharacterized protein n=1 Tax=Brassica cretica TaxID=69181 RepID=A0A8S9JFI6_BRACR|nr:hypothetical protein F2Q68_00005940 [Brassica cretica]